MHARDPQEAKSRWSNIGRTDRKGDPNGSLMTLINIALYVACVCARARKRSGMIADVAFEFYWYY